MAAALAMLSSLAAGCGDDGASEQESEPVAPALQPGQVATIITDGLPRLENAAYELWATTGDEQVLMGRFNLDEDGGPIELTGQLNEQTGELEDVMASPTVLEAIAAVDAFAISLEALDADEDAAGPRGPVVLSGDATLPTSAVSFPINLFAAAGGFTVGAQGPGEEDELAGIWFGSQTGDGLSPSLVLPELGDGWRWAAWLEQAGSGDGEPIRLGSFVAADGPFQQDAAASSPAAARLPAAQVPGVDLAGLQDDDSAIDLSRGSWEVWIGLEPVLDGSPEVLPRPFPLRVLSAPIPAGVEAGDLVILEQVPGAEPGGEVQL